ncbi:MAG: 30S ribosomal protein S15 [Halobacteria archaeon]
MAKMHTRRRGSSKSSRVNRKTPPEWLMISPKEIEKLAVKLRTQGLSSSKIGIVLRDKYGVPDVEVATGKKITQILRENKIAPEIPEDLQNLIKKALRLKAHLANSPKDLHNKRSLQNTESKIRRLVNYYREEGVLPADWEYRPEIAELMAAK